MNRPEAILVVGLVLGGVVAPLSAQTGPRPTRGALAIEHVTVIPMNVDTTLADHTVLVQGDRISWIGPARGAPVPAEARRIDGRGRYLVPGLADMHVHLRRADELPAFVASGITTVRNMNGEPIHLVWRNRAAREDVVSPRIYTAGPAIGVGFVHLATPAAADEYVRAQQRAGYDFIKILSDIELPVFSRVVQSARAADMHVVGHVVQGIGSTHALAAGQVSFEHANVHMFAGGEGALAEGARAIAAAGTWVGTLISQRDGRCGPPTVIQRSIMASLRAANVRLLAGTDAGIGPLRAGMALHCELATLVAAGLAPYEALASATRNAGEFAQLHLKERVPFGTVTVGAQADLVLLPADPRRDIGALTRPLGTVLRGRWLPR